MRRADGGIFQKLGGKSTEGGRRVRVTKQVFPQRAPPTKEVWEGDAQRETPSHSGEVGALESGGQGCRSGPPYHKHIGLP